MRALSEYNPVTVTVYFLTVTGIAMFCMNPILLTCSLLGAISYSLLQNERMQGRAHFAYALLFVIMALINPIFSHNGVTVLFVLNDAPITLEALMYGIVAAGMIVTVLYWFNSFTKIMTSDRLLYLFGRLSPRLALVLSMGLRYVSLLSRQSHRVEQSQTALGLYKEDNLIDRMRGKIRVFSIMVTWALENGIVTADSMAARGYGIGKRSNFSVFRFRCADLLLTIITLALGLVTCAGIGLGALEFTFYPTLGMAEWSPAALMSYTAYAILTVIPTVLEAEECIKWKYLRSRI